MTNAVLQAVLEDAEDSLRMAEVPHLDRLLTRLEEVLDLLRRNLLMPEQSEHVLMHAMPKLLLILLKLRCSDADMGRLNVFFQAVLRTTVELLRTSTIWELIECATRVLTDSSVYHMCRPTIGGGAGALSPAGAALVDELESNSSGEGSGSEGSLYGEGGAGYEGGPAGILSANTDDFSPYYVQNVEQFHQLGGFHACIARIGREPHVSLLGVKMLLRPLIKVKDLLSRHALQSFARAALGAVMGHLSSLTDEQLKQEDRKTMQDLQNTVEIMLHAAKLPDAHRLVDEWTLALAVKCMRSQNLEKRLYGLGEIKEVVNTSLRKHEYHESLRERETNGGGPQQLPPSPSTWSTPETIVAWLQREQLVELIFGEGLHDQVVRRCQEVLRFLALCNAFDQRLLDIVWRASLDKHESVKQAIYSVVIELSACLPLDLLDVLYSRIRSISHAEYTQHTVTLLRGFSVSALQSPHNPQKARRWYGLEDFWQLMQQGTHASHEVRATALQMLGDMLVWPTCAAQRTVYLERCVMQLRAGESVAQALRLCQRVVGAFPNKPRKKGATDVHQASDVLQCLDETHELLDAYFADFERYHAMASQRLEIFATHANPT